MESTEPARLSIVATIGRRPDLEELNALDEGWSEAALSQLMAAAAAVDGWLAEHPDEAARFVGDPAAVIEEVREAGVLTEPVDDLLGVLRARPRPGPQMIGRVVRFAAESPLRSKRGYGPGNGGDR